MNEDLYFIPIIGRAFQDAETEAALKNAFDEIKHLGKQKQYREGFSNFKRFMGQVCKYYRLQESYSMHHLIAEVATETFAGSEKETSSARIKPTPAVEIHCEPLFNVKRYRESGPNPVELAGQMIKKVSTPNEEGLPRNL